MPRIIGSDGDDGGGVPLSNVFYVDPHSTNVGIEDGSDERPFKTLQDAFDGVFGPALLGEVTFLICPCFFGANAGSLVIPDDLPSLFMSIVGLAASNRPILTAVASMGMGATPTVDVISGAEGGNNIAINFQSVSVNAIDLAEEGASGGRLSFWGSQIGQIDCNIYDVLSVDSSMGETQVATLEAYASSGQDCTWTANEIRIDTATLFQATQNSVAFAPGLPTIMGYPKATISVAVPALAADVLGYVDVSTVGTDLEGIVAGDPITAAPQADLAAAGANNGGFLNARVSAADTIRCAFLGTLAGGATNFLFSRA